MLCRYRITPRRSTVSTQASTPTDDHDPMPELILSTKDFSWLPDGAWESDDLLYFASHAPTVQTQIVEPPPYQRPGKVRTPETASRWILKAAGQRLGFAELQGFWGPFSWGFLWFRWNQKSDESRIDTADEFSRIAREALAQLISGSLINYELAMLKVVGGTQSDEQWLMGLNWLPAEHSKSLWTPIPTESKTVIAGQSKRSWHVESVSWWASDDGQVHRTTLAYLERRVEHRRAARIAKQRPPRRRPLFQFFPGRR